MKKPAFPLALIASITACCLCAWLLGQSSACRLGYVFFPESMLREPILEYACYDVPPPLSHSTTASVPVTNADLHVSFRQPEGWTLIDSGTKRNAPWLISHATYGPRGYPDAPTLKITYSDSGWRTDPGDEDILVSNEVNDAHYRGEQVVEELRERIDGLLAGGVKYTIERKVGFRVRATQPHQTNYFEWTSDVEYSDELERIYRAMLPTITFVPPIEMPIPIRTATPTAVGTYVHPLRPTPQPLRRTPQPDFILGAMLSPELNTVVRGALSLLKACSPETWAFVHQYAYAINAPPTPQMNYHMVRYSGVVLLSQTDLFRWPSQSLQEFAAMAAIVHQSRHLWQSETHFIADPDVLERDAYRFELQVFDNPTCVSTVPTEDRASLAIMRRTVEESIKNPPTPP